MTLTKRQWIMFTLFIIELAYVLFTAAFSGSLLDIASSLSRLLFLGALYLENNYNSKRILLLAGVWLIVGMIFQLMQVLPVIIASLSVFAVFDLTILVLLYIGIYLFSMKYYNGNFYNKKENIIITLLVIPTILFGFYNLYLFLTLPIISNPIALSYTFMGILSRMIIPLSITTYTWLRHKNIE